MRRLIVVLRGRRLEAGGPRLWRLATQVGGSWHSAAQRGRNQGRGSTFQHEAVGPVAVEAHGRAGSRTGRGDGADGGRLAAAG